jgi:hypothetical protein
MSCAVHTAVTVEHKCSRLFTAGTIHIAIDDAFTAGPASALKKGQSAGAVWNENGRGRAHLGRDGGEAGQ